MDVLILDTSIIIDLYNGDILSMVSNLPYEIGISDAIIPELIQPSYAEVSAAGINEFILSAESIAEVYTLTGKYQRLSIPDIFSLVVADKNDAILLTGDKWLRKAASLEGVGYQGIFWILDQFLNNSIMTKEQARNSLTNIIAKGSRLPKTECDKRLEEWK